jgi:hypothetical protein
VRPSCSPPWSFQRSAKWSSDFLGVKVTTAVRARDDNLRAAFAAQKGELELCSHLLCGQQEIATQLLEAAWARTATIWRGPVTADLNDYVLCVLVQLVRARENWMDPQPPSVSGARSLTSLPLDSRVAVVLHEFAGMPLDKIGAITGRPPQSVEADIRAGETTLARAAPPGGKT